MTLRYHCAMAKAGDWIVPEKYQVAFGVAALGAILYATSWAKTKKAKAATTKK